MGAKQRKGSMKRAVLVLGVLSVVIAASIVMLPLGVRQNVTDFTTCAAAGRAILESYPQQCRIDGAVYVDETQVRPKYPQASDDSNAYIGLTEEAALMKATREHTPARVVERDDEALPVTMDFVLGRYNLYVQDGNVYKVDIEGATEDS